MDTLVENWEILAMILAASGLTGTGGGLVAVWFRSRQERRNDFDIVTEKYAELSAKFEARVKTLEEKDMVKDAKIAALEKANEYLSDGIEKLTNQLTDLGIEPAWTFEEGDRRGDE